MSDSFCREDLQATLESADLFAWASKQIANAAPEYIFRAREGRTTLRIDLPAGSFFLKYHVGVGWREIFKNLLQLRWPVLGARTEWRAIQCLQRAGVPSLTVAAYASRGWNPARQESLLLTEALLDTVSLETLCADWPQQRPALRRQLLRRVAKLAQRMHGAGVNHRDFYLCHILVPNPLPNDDPPCTLIDLHRAQCRRRTPRRWRIKDLAALYFSAMDCGLTHREQLRFLRHYHGSLHTALRANSGLWQAVQRRAHAMHAREQRRRAQGQAT